MLKTRAAKLLTGLLLLASLVGFGAAYAAPGAGAPIAPTPETIWCYADGLPCATSADCGNQSVCACVAGECRSR